MPPVNPLALPPGPRQAIEIEAKTGPADGNGEPTWQTILSCLAVLATIGSREVSIARQFTGETTHLVALAYTPGVVIKTGMRVLFAGRYLTIFAPPENVQERNRRINLNCQEIGDSGPIA